MNVCSKLVAWYPINTEHYGVNELEPKLSSYSESALKFGFTVGYFLPATSEIFFLYVFAISVSSK